MNQRVIDEIVDMELSVGDFVPTGGEIPAMAVVDTVSRLIPGVLAAEGSYENESHYNGLLNIRNIQDLGLAQKGNSPKYLYRGIMRI